MVVLDVAIGLVAVLCLFNLLLTFGVIRRLRQHLEKASKNEFGFGEMMDMPVMGLGISERVPAFSALTTSGELVTEASRLQVVAFFSTTCSVCKEKVGPFMDYVTSHGVPWQTVLSTIVGPGAGESPYLDKLASVGQVHLEPDGGETSSAFQVSGFPAFGLVDDGVLTAAGFDPAALPKPVAAR